MSKAKEEFKSFSKEEKKEEIRKREKEAKKEEELKEIEADIATVKTPAQLETRREAYKNNPEAVDLINAFANKKANEETANSKEPVTTDVDTILEYYEDKPFARKRKYNVDSQEELVSKLSPEPSAEVQEQKGKSFLDSALKYQQQQEAATKEKADSKEKDKVDDTDQAETTEQPEQVEPTQKEEVTPAPAPVDNTRPVEKKEDKPVKQILNESVENENRKEVTTNPEKATDEIPQKEETNNAESEELEQTFETEEGIDQSYAQVYDVGLFKFQQYKGKWGIYLNHVKSSKGAFFPVNSVEEVKDAQGNYLHHKVDASNIADFHIPKKLRVNEYYPLKDASGYPVKSSFGNFIRDYDVDVVKELYKHRDEEVFIEIDVTDDFNADKNSTRIRMDYVIYPNGKRTVIGVMPAVKKNSKDSYFNLREQIFKELQANNRNSNTDSNSFRYSKSTKIGKILGGRFNTFYDKANRNDPKSAINDGNPLILGIGYNIPG